MGPEWIPFLFAGIVLGSVVVGWWARDRAAQSDERAYLAEAKVAAAELASKVAENGALRNQAKRQNQALKSMQMAKNKLLRIARDADVDPRAYARMLREDGRGDAGGDPDAAPSGEADGESPRLGGVG